MQRLKLIGYFSGIPLAMEMIPGVSWRIESLPLDTAQVIERCAASGGKWIRVASEAISHKINNALYCRPLPGWRNW